MSKRSCEYCRYFGDGCRCRAMERQITSSILFERGCQHFEELKQTVFDKITESVEALAENLVFWEGGWTSRFIKFTTTNHEDAIAATVEELKKEWKK